MLSPLKDSPQKLKLEKIQENSSFLCKPEFSSATKTKNKHSSASDWWELRKYSFKENDKIVSKSLPLKKILEFQNQKKGL